MTNVYINGIIVKLLLYDFDGVMTDNKVYVSENGKESVMCNRSDGLAVSKINKLGVPQAIISTETNKIVAIRAKKLKIPVIYGVKNKKDTVFSYTNKLGIGLKETLYIGNDLNDLEAMQFIGFPVCPNDAYKEIREISKLILSVNGGYGVIRELFDKFEIK